MGNKEDVFRFKQFQVRQNQNVHRVGTDGVLLGAWADVNKVKSVLDIGTGTGVIAMMLAQRLDSKSKVVAIEPQDDAYRIANQNIQESPFNHIQLHHTSLQNFKTDFKFDLVVCNPPFFEKSLKPPSENRKQERHNDSLSWHDLISQAKSLLNNDGRLTVILPTVEGNNFKALAMQSGFNTLRQCAVYSKQSKPQERWLMEFKLKTNIQTQDSILTIMSESGDWTTEYRQLTKDYYLKF